MDDQNHAEPTERLKAIAKIFHSEADLTQLKTMEGIERQLSEST